MKTRLLKKLRKCAKKEFTLEAISDYYRIITYVTKIDCKKYPVTMSTATIKELAIKELFKWRRDFILNTVKEKRREKLNKELRKI